MSFPLEYYVYTKKINIFQILKRPLMMVLHLS